MSDKPVILTRHASARMRERGIQLAWAEATIRNPLWTEPEPRDPSAERRFSRIGDYGDCILRVVYVETENAIRVMMATFDRGARKPK